MKRLLRLAPLLLLAPLQACSTANGETRTTGTADQICKDWSTIRPSRKDDKLSEDTARQIAGNNAARGTWCKNA